MSFENFKSHFEMHERFRNGIFLLAILIFIVILIYFFFPFSQNTNANFQKLSRFQEQIDSLKRQSVSKRKGYQLQPFNPNFITDYKGYRLGISPQELDKLYAYRKENKWINSIGDFQKVTGVSDSLLTHISPLFKFPDWINTSNFKKKDIKPKLVIKSYEQKGDLNKITPEELQSIIGIPDFISKRIINHRKKLDGFLSDIQLKDVDGLYDHQRDKLLSLYTVKIKSDFRKININTATVKELMEVPYFDFETALEIADYIKERKGISDLKELAEIEGVSLEKIDRIALYLVLK